MNTRRIGAAAFVLAGLLGAAAAGPASAHTLAAPGNKAGVHAQARAAVGAAVANRPARTVRPMHVDGTCNAYSNGTGDLCLWYFYNYGGSKVDFYYGDSNLWDNVFLTVGSGQGRVVANNAESDWNYDGIYTAWVYTGTSYTGVGGYIPPRTGGNFTSTFANNVESLSWS